MTTGMIIKNLRTEKNWSQEKLAGLMGYSHKSSINKIEMGKSDLPQSKLLAFAKVFMVNPSDLLPTEQPKTASKNNQSTNLVIKTKALKQIQILFGKDAVKLLLLYAQLNNHGKTKVFENLSDCTTMPKYTNKVHIIKEAARNGNFSEKVVSDSELSDIKEALNALPDVDDLK